MQRVLDCRRLLIRVGVYVGEKHHADESASDKVYSILICLAKVEFNIASDIKPMLGTVT